MKKFFIIFIFVLFCSQQMLAEAQDKIKIQGFVQLDNFYYQNLPESWQEEGTVNFKLKTKLGDWLFKSELEARANTLGLERGVGLEGGEYRPFLGVEEAYLAYHQEKYQFKFGIMKVNWGITDKFNPLDLINPQDFTDLLHSRKIGQLIWQFSYLPWSSGRIDLVVAPFWLASRLPPEDSPYFYGLADVPIHYWLQDSNWGESQIGLRFYQQLDRLELYGVAYKGYDHLPFVSYNYLANELIYEYEPMTAVGFGWVYAWSKFIWRVEAAYYFYDHKSEENYGSYVMGLDYNVGQIGRYSLYLIWQYLGETPIKEDPTWVRHLFTNASSLKITLSDVWLEVSLEGVYNFPNDSLILIPSVAYSYKDWRFGLEYNYLAGPKGSLWDYCQQANNLSLSVRYSY